MSADNYLTFLFYFFMHGYVYLLCIHHDILEQSHKRERESLVSPFDIPHPSGEFDEAIRLNCPVVSST